MNLHDLLLQKAKKQELAHFYILETSAPRETAHDTLLSFTHGFIKDYYQKVEGHKQSLKNLMDHPDVFVLGYKGGEDEDKNEKAFKVEEAETFSRFFEYRAIQALRKFAVITEAHRINQTIANKWLKLLEEPLGTSTIFLLNPRRVELLSTIHSRAIHLRVVPYKKVTEENLWRDFIHRVKEMTLSEFLEENSRQGELSFWVNEAIQWEAEQNDHFAPKKELELLLKDLQEMEAFNQPAATKWTLFYTYLREQVINRLN